MEAAAICLVVLLSIYLWLGVNIITVGGTRSRKTPSDQPEKIKSSSD
jgi:hypothetical protein